MMFLKLIAKVLVLPIAVCLWAFKWIGTFCTAMSHWIFDILASLLFLLGIIGLITDQLTSITTIEAFIASFIVFLIPRIAQRLVVCASGISARMFNFIRG